MKKYATMIAALSLSACASITTGSSQTLSVDTSPVQGAQCKLTNDKGSWFINSTPGTVTVSRAYSPLSITCNKNGYSVAVQSVESSTKGMAAGNILFGLIGGPIGGAVDAGTGAAYDYPAVIAVAMNKESSGNRK